MRGLIRPAGGMAHRYDEESADGAAPPRPRHEAASGVLEWPWRRAGARLV